VKDTILCIIIEGIYSWHSLIGRYKTKWFLPLRSALPHWSRALTLSP